MRRGLAFPVLLWVLLWLVAVLAPPARALESAPVRSDRATVALVTATDAYAPGQSFRVGLLFRLSPGWHVYWQNPGDAGTAPELAFKLPPGVQAGAVAWPAPQVLREGPIVVYSYEDQVLLPVRVTPPADMTGPLRLALHADWLVCAKICVPEQGDFALDLPAGTPGPSAQQALFAQTDRLIPRAAPFDARIAPDGTLRVTGPGLGAGTVARAWFLPAAWGPIDQSAPEPFTADPGGITLRLKPGSAFKPDADLAGVLGVQDGSGAVSYYTLAARPGAVAPVPDPPAAAPSLARMMLFALLGGLILNLMPCVFPVLAMKALALARSGGMARSHARATAVAYLAGVLAAFGALGGALLAARAAGSAAGWGFQFQSPAFVAAMAFVLFAVGLNLSGVFEVSGRATGLGQGLAARGGFAGSFFTGLLAVVVATPCTAPFMGAAIAAALSASAPAAMAIFLSLGVGLALPYLVLAEVPVLARHLPRPGRWMDVLKQALAFPMYAATAWLVWVLSQQAGPAGLPLALGGLVLVGLAAWAMGVGAGLGARGRLAARGLAALALVGALAALPGIGAAGPAAAPAQAATANEEPFSEARLAALRAAGRPVFVNLTAAWCVSCLVNERVALSADAVRAAFAAHDIAYLKGDWTRQDPAISAFLRAHGRDGVPLYLFYRRGATTPVVLPQILTPRLVLNEVDRSGT